MKELPIIFSAESIAAILRNDKTQTRRPIKPQPAGIRHSVFVPPLPSRMDRRSRPV